MKFLYVLLLVAAACPLPAAAQLSLTQIGAAASMSFDIGGSSSCSGSLGWTDNVTIPNCYTNRGSYCYSNGCNNTGAVHVAGSNGETALGGRASNSTSLIQWGVRIANNTGLVITSLHVRYHAEQWSSAQSGGVANTVSFAYQVSSSPITSISGGAYTQFPALNMTSFVSQSACGGSTAAIDGNDPAHSAWVEACIPATIPAGGEIMLRWNDPNNACNDHMLCTDDLTVTPLSGNISIATNTPVCAGDTIHLATQPHIDGATYTLTGPNGFTAAVADTFLAPAQPAQSGTYTLTATLGSCAAQTVAIDVVVNNPITTTIDTAICQGLQYTFASNVYYTPGTYTVADTLATSMGCNSIVNLHLVIHGIIKDTTSAAICMGAAYSFNGASITTAGYYSDTLVSATGCDSISTLHLTVNPVYHLSVADTICHGLTYTWAGSNYTATGSYPHTFATIAGCDSVVTLNLNVLPPLDTATAASICAGEQYSVGVHQYTTTGQYTDTLTAAGGCDSIVKLTLFVKPLPAPPATAGVRYCQFDSTATALTAVGDSLRWYNDVGSIPAPVPPTGTPGTTTWYVTQTVQGCESPRASLPVTITATPNAVIAPLKNPVCSSDSIVVVYSGTGTPAMQYHWNAPGARLVGDGSIGPVTIYPASPGTQQVSLQVNNEGCKSNTALTEVTVLPALQLIATMPQEVCAGQVAEVALNHTNLTSEASFTWNFDGGDATGDGGNPHQVSWSTPGTRLVTLDATYKGCPSDEWQGAITVNPLPAVAIDPATVPTALCTLDTATLAITGPARYQYRWAPAAFMADTSVPGQARITVLRPVVVTVTAVNEYGCTSADSVFINAGPCCELSLPSAFSPNGDGHNDVFRTITAGNHQIVYFRVLNRWGQSVFETEDETRGWDGTFNGTPQDAGTYYYVLRYKCSNGNFYDKTGDLLLIR